tara:strand:+ start:2357 stop:2530 length:174 start_codon:yes stop_codon:yes gene_type:complete
MIDTDKHEIQKMILEHCELILQQAQEFVWSSKRYTDTRISNLQKRVRYLEKELELND